jgi:hypothetical protein
MKILPAEDYNRWQVEIGYHQNYPHGSQQVVWHATGHGCLVHSQVVLTSLQIWKEWQTDPHWKSELKMRIGKTEYPCQLGHQEPDANLAALVLTTPAMDTEGQAFKTFPQMADELPRPGQTLGILIKQGLRRQTARDSGHRYMCYTFGRLSLLQRAQELLYGLSGLEWRDHHFGNAVFDEDGKLYGVTTDYLRANCNETLAVDARTGYLVFSPVTSKTKQATELVMKQLQ